MHRDEPELAGMAGGTGDHDAARFEQGSELGVGRTGPPAGRHRRLRRVDSDADSDARRQLDQRVDGDRGAVGPHDQRVHVHAHDVGVGCRRLRQSEQDSRELVTIDRGLATELAEQPLRGERVDHVLGVDRRNRDRAEHDVGDRFGEDAADAQHHVHAELRIAHEAGDQLAIARHHGRHEHGDVAVIRRRGRQQLGCRGDDGPAIGEPQPNEAALGLVCDRITAELGDHRIAELVGSITGGVGRDDLAFGGERHVMASEQSLRRDFGERAAGSRHDRSP